MDSQIFDSIENDLDAYIRQEPTHPDMKIFCGFNNYEPKDVYHVIQNSVCLDLKEWQKNILLSSFKKKEEENGETTIIVETISEWSGRRRREIRKEFLECDLSVQEFLEVHPNVSEQLLRNILPKEVWTARYKYAERNDWKELLRIFLEEVPDLSVQQFCTEQGIPIKGFQRVVPKEIWDKRFDRKKRVINWDEEIAGMKASGLCIQDWAAEHGLSCDIFKKKLGEEATKLYDRDGRRASAFNPDLSLQENAEILRLTPSGLTAWINKKLKILNPEKFRAFKMDDKDIQIADLNNKISEQNGKITELEAEIAKLKQHLANKNSFINQMQLTASQKAAKVTAAKKALEEVLKAL